MNAIAAPPRALAVADAGPMVDPCDPTPRPPTCGVTSAPVPRDPPGMSHRVPPADVEPIGPLHADLFSDLARCRVAVDRMGRTLVRRERLSVITVALAPVVPALLGGDDVADLAPVDDYLPCRGEAVPWDDGVSLSS